MKLNPIFLFHNAGRFLSRGHGRHSTRSIDTFELIYVLSGTLDLFENEQEFHLAQGERLLLHPGRKHGGLSAYQPDLSFFWMHFMPSDSDSSEILKTFPQYAKINEPETFVAYWQMLLTEQRNADHAESCNYLASLLIRKAENTSPGIEASAAKRLIEETDRFIMLHFEEEISTSVIAEKLQCHPDYLGRIYAQSHHCTIGDAIREKRIAHACRLLENSMMSVKQIGFESGFNDPSYFRKQFFRECSVSPHKYRKLHTGGHVNTE